MLDHLTTIGRPERPSLPAKVVIHATHRGFFGLRPQNDISLSSYLCRDNVVGWCGVDTRLGKVQISCVGVVA